MGSQANAFTLFFKVLTVLIAWLVAADIVGVVICTVFDILPVRGESGMLPFAIWFVIGVFTGLFIYASAGAWIVPTTDGDWTDRPDSARIGTHIIAISAVILLALGGLFRWLYWSRGVDGEYYVPDSAPHTMLFFATILCAMVLARVILTSDAAARPDLS